MFWSYTTNCSVDLLRNNLFSVVSTMNTHYGGGGGGGRGGGREGGGGGGGGGRRGGGREGGGGGGGGVCECMQACTSVWSITALDSLLSWGRNLHGATVEMLTLENFLWLSLSPH